jgi:CPA2 family monovalent cation:H+ antiporter-2
MNESAFFQDLAMLMSVAGLTAALFSRLRWPKVLGYIFAGVLMGANTWGGSFLVDTGSVQTLGQLGVVFLMFSMGLDFSASEMKKIKSVAFPCALVDTIVMTWIGYVVGHRLLGWGQLPSLFLGAAICDSATTMLAKIVGELKWNDRPFVKYALGTSVCEDIVCIGIIAFITGVANGGGVSISAVGRSLGGLVVFFLATLVFGFVLVPRLLQSVGRSRDDEALVLTILGCCFFVSFIAYRFEFSLALGAFLVGIVGSSSVVRHRLMELVSPLRSMFAAVFFLSIGLLVDPRACLSCGREIALLTAVVVVGKFLNCSLTAIACGERVKTAVQLGMGLAQIGEFAFMVAMLYSATTGDAKAEIFQIVVAVSLLTTLLNPLMLRLSEPFGTWVEARVPARLASGLEAYRVLLEKYRMRSTGSSEGETVRNCLRAIAAVAVLELAVEIVVSMLYGRDWSNFSVFFETHKSVFFLLLFNAVFIVLVAPVQPLSTRLGEAFAKVLVAGEDARWQMSVRRFVRFAVPVATAAFFFVEMLALNAIADFAPKDRLARVVTLVVLIVLGVLCWRALKRLALRAVSRFNEAVSADERREKIARMVTLELPADEFHRLDLDARSPALGETVVTLNIRAKTGASVVAVERDGQIERRIDPTFEFRAGDRLVVVGDGHAVAALKDLLGIVS